MTTLRTLTAALTAILIIAADTACTRHNDNLSETVRQTEALFVTTSSVAITGSDSLWIDSEGRVVSCDTAFTPVAQGNMPTLQSAMPIIDAAFTTAMSALSQSECSPLTLACVCPFANPKEAKTLAISSLRALTSSVDSAATWPLIDYSPEWIVAAERVWTIVGDDSLLNSIYTQAAELCTLSRSVNYIPRHNLMQGGPRSMPPFAVKPRWMSAVNAYECLNLNYNASTVAALRALATMTNGIGADGSKFEEQADSLSRQINLLLWMPDLGRYSQYLYNTTYPIASRISDNFAQPLAILAGIPTREMADKILTSSPWMPIGISGLMPSPAGTPPLTLADMDPATHTLWALAASKSNNERVVSAALSTLLARCFGSNAHPEAPVGVAAIVLNVFAGLTPTPDALEFHPLMPEYTQGKLILNGVWYKNVQLDITINGVGNRIARFIVDGAETPDYTISASLSGRHTVEIFLANNSLSSPELPEEPQQWALSVPEVRWLSHGNGYIEDTLPGAQYKLIENGTYLGIDLSDEFCIVPLKTFTTLCVLPGKKNHIASYGSAPHEISPYYKTFQAEDFATAGTNLIRDRRLARLFVENATTATKEIEFEVNITKPGDYILRLCYSNGSGSNGCGFTTAIRTLKVNGSFAGMFVMPPRGIGWWLSTGFSNSLSAHLNEGKNTITVAMIDLGRGDSPVLVDYLKIIKL